jgi:hypothetical protein
LERAGLDAAVVAGGPDAHLGARSSAKEGAQLKAIRLPKTP